VDVTPHGPWQAMSKTARGFTPPCRLWRTPPTVRVIAIVVLACIASAPPLRSLPERREPIASATSTPLVVSHPQVLVVFSDDPSQTWIRDLTDGFAQASSGAGATAPAWYFEYLDAVRFQDERHVSDFRAAIRDKYRDRHLDLVIAVASNAIKLMADARDDLWPDVPVLFANYAGPVPLETSALTNASSLSFEYGVDAALLTMKTVFPDITTVAVSTGSSQAERLRESDVDDEIGRAGLKYFDVAPSSAADAKVKVGRLPDRSILFLAGGQLDESGVAIPSWQLCETISRAANRPTIMLGSQFLGCGIVGGLMRDYVKVGAVIAARGIAAASAQPGGPENVSFASIATLKFDARQLERWGVDERRLPPGSIIAFRDPSLWRDYRGQVLAFSAALLLQLTLIAGLLYERRARRKAEIDSRRNLSLAANIDRRASIAALTGSIAHELSQPLSAILHNAQAAEMLIASNRATPTDLQDILRDIRTQDVRATEIVQRHRGMLAKHDVKQETIDLFGTVRESLALIAHDAARRQVHVDTRLPSGPCPVVADKVLLQQVVVNLVVNAMDAMATTPPGSRHVVIRNAMSPESVEISIQDNGTGLSSELDGRLFEPFVSTKSDGIGIGLTITRSIVDMHDGTIDARNNPGGGATFRFTLPRLAVS
jgi:signal transduction histidine kinase